jgi:O-antigen/teichoic acid export membrane protein
LLVGLPLLGVLVTGADWATGFIYGPKWESAAPLIWALAPHVACDLIALHLITFVQGQGRAGLALFVYALWSASLWVTSVAALALTSGNLVAVALAHGVSSMVTVGLLLVWASRHLGRRVIGDLAMPLAAGIAAFAAAFACARWLTPSDLAGALATTAVFLATFGFILFVFDRKALARELRAALAALA